MWGTEYYNYELLCAKQVADEQGVDLTDALDQLHRDVWRFFTTPVRAFWHMLYRSLAQSHITPRLHHV